MYLPLKTYLCKSWYWSVILRVLTDSRLRNSPGLKTICTFEPRHDKTNKMTVRPAKTQISLGIRPVWSESSLCAWWVAKAPSFLHADSEVLHADSEDSDQTGRMPRLIWVFAGRTLILLVLSFLSFAAHLCSSWITSVAIMDSREYITWW